MLSAFLKFNTEQANSLRNHRMKQLAIFAFTILCSFQLLISQVETQEVNYDFQIAYCIGSSAATAWIGEDLVVMVEAETPEDRDPDIMDQVVSVLSDIVGKYELFTGLDELPIASEFDGKPVIEVVVDNCGAGGLASHGVLGMSTGTFFLDQFYSNLENGNVAVPQVFLYELNRNFWKPSFNNKFDWAMNDEPANWGWWTVGMNNAQAVMLPISLGIEMDYFGNDLAYFRDRMVGELEDYMNDEQYDFDFGWRQSLMPWHDTESINDLMSGLLIYSYENFGGEDWMMGFYEHIENIDIPDRSDVFAYQECRDNICKIWSLAANENLADFFFNDLRWEISAEALLWIEAELNPSGLGRVRPSSSISIFPNPSRNHISIAYSDQQITNGSAEIVSATGQILRQLSLSESKTKVDIEFLVPGFYMLRSGKSQVSFIKQ